MLRKMMVLRLSAMNPTTRHVAAITTFPEMIMSISGCCPKFKVVRNHIAARTASSSMHTGNSTMNENEHIIILGGGMAGLSTARYLLHHTTKAKKTTRITLIDGNPDILSANKNSPYSSYEEQICCQRHLNVPSRRNGNVIWSAIFSNIMLAFHFSLLG